VNHHLDSIAIVSAVLESLERRVIMESREVLRTMLDHSGKSRAEISRRIKRSDSYVGVLLARKTAPQIDNFVKVARECGYRVYVEGNGERIDITS